MSTVAIEFLHDAFKSRVCNHQIKIETDFAKCSFTPHFLIEIFSVSFLFSIQICYNGEWMVF